MSIKLGVDFITPLFVAFDVSTEGEVVIICDIIMRSQCLTKQVWNLTNTLSYVVVVLDVTHQPLPPTIALIVNSPPVDFLIT